MYLFVNLRLLLLHLRICNLSWQHIHKRHIRLLHLVPPLYLVANFLHFIILPLCFQRHRCQTIQLRWYG